MLETAEEPNKIFEQDFGYDLEAKELTQTSLLDAEQESPEYVRQMVSILLKEPHDRFDRMLNQIRDLISKLPIFNNLILKDDEPVNQ